MAPATTLSLSAWPKPEEQTEPLVTFFQRIAQDRGPFRNLNEEQLQKEIDDGEGVKDSVETMDEDLPEVETEDLNERGEKLTKARVEAIQNIQYELPIRSLIMCNADSISGRLASESIKPSTFWPSCSPKHLQRP